MLLWEYCNSYDTITIAMLQYQVIICHNNIKIQQTSCQVSPKYLPVQYITSLQEVVRGCQVGTLQTTHTFKIYSCIAKCNNTNWKLTKHTCQTRRNAQLYQHLVWSIIIIWSWYYCSFCVLISNWFRLKSEIACDFFTRHSCDSLSEQSLCECAIRLYYADIINFCFSL